MANFEHAIAVVLLEEGVHSPDPADPGGDTWYGISRVAHPTEMPWPPTRKRALEIYRLEYWTPILGDELEDEGIALTLLDTAVNQGVGTAIRIAQEALGVTADGILGPVTKPKLLAIAAGGGGIRTELLDTLTARRALHYTRVADFPRYGLDWFERVARIHRRASIASWPSP